MNEISILARLSLSLRPLEERVLNALAWYPLLCASQLAVLLDADLSNVTKACKTLQAFGLIEAHRAVMPKRDHTGRHIPLVHYLLTAAAIRYLAAQEGIGSNVRVNQYIKARHWENGFARLVHQLNHTRWMNAFFVEMHKCARTRGMQCDWRSEFDARIYFQSNYQQYLERRPTFGYKPQSQSRRGEAFRSLNRRKILALLPDGIGVIQTPDVRHLFALEVDLTRSARDKLGRKLREYLLANMEKQFEGTILVLTTSWQRARTWREMVWDTMAFDPEDGNSAQDQTPLIESGETILPVWITTIHMFKEQGVTEPIWWNVWKREELSRLEWFV